MPSTPRRALVAGATGLVGGQVLDLLLGQPEYEQVTALVLRPLGHAHPKLTELVIDFERLPGVQADLQCDDAYACLGTTIKVAGSEERFRRVDHDYTLGVARLARERGAKRLGLVSSIGASARSRTFYLSVKGETEDDLTALGFDTLALARPSFLMGERQEHRSGEKIGIAVFRALSFTMAGPLRVYRPIEARDVARAMIAALLAGAPGKVVLDHDALLAFAKRL
jgi:uncharacterized protein YbjT (DUF2867 family)